MVWCNNPRHYDISAWRHLHQMTRGFIVIIIWSPILGIMTPPLAGEILLNIWVPSPSQKLWDLLYHRGKVNKRDTKYFAIFCNFFFLRDVRCTLINNGTFTTSYFIHWKTILHTNNLTSFKIFSTQWTKGTNICGIY